MLRRPLPEEGVAGGTVGAPPHRRESQGEPWVLPPKQTGRGGWSLGVLEAPRSTKCKQPVWTLHAGASAHLSPQRRVRGLLSLLPTCWRAFRSTPLTKHRNSPTPSGVTYRARP